MLSEKTTKADLKVMKSYNSTKTSVASATPLRDYTHMVYRHHLGSGLAKQQKKKNSDRKSSSAIASGTWSSL
jgi:hypothetical protein